MASSRHEPTPASGHEDAEAFPAFEDRNPSPCPSQQPQSPLELNNPFPNSRSPQPSTFQIPRPAQVRPSYSYHGHTDTSRDHAGPRIPMNRLPTITFTTSRDVYNPEQSGLSPVLSYQSSNTPLTPSQDPSPNGPHSRLRIGTLRTNASHRARSSTGPSSHRPPPPPSTQQARNGPTSISIMPSAPGNNRSSTPSAPTIPDININGEAAVFDPPVGLGVGGGVSRRRSLSNAARSVVSKFGSSDPSGASAAPGYAYRSQVVDLLDVVDPEIAALTTLNNVQNSLFVPNLGRFLNRRPTYQLSRPTTIESEDSGRTPTESDAELSRTVTRYVSEMPSVAPAPREGERSSSVAVERTRTSRHLQTDRVQSITSNISDSHYAVLPHGETLEGWTEEDKAALDDHVRHMLHSKRSKFKQNMKAFGKYIRKPLGFLVTLYAFLITMFGAAWVIFLIGWISLGSRRNYIIDVIDNVLVALFAVMGDGLAPFRMVDTYHMFFIARYHRLTKKVRRARALPKLQDINDLPVKMDKDDNDLEDILPDDSIPADNEYSVLTQLQQQRLAHHQLKFAKSHSFYKPHETMTHFAFPHHIFVAIVLLLDLHSCLQISLGACTWGISYKHRPFALTTSILAASITVNITAGILIMVGDRKTRKKEVLEIMKRQKMTHSAMKKVKKHKRERERERDEGGRSESSGSTLGANSSNSNIRRYY